LFPLLADARKPKEYAGVVESNLDCIVQDVATRGQADVANRNAQFLGEDGLLLAAVKARSEDVVAEPAQLFEEVTATLEKKYEVLETVRLDPYHEDHLGVVARTR
jgi:fibrillarin-like pre-rRNA processing protein